MQTQVTIPEYLTDNFSMYIENMTSLSDPENPDLLTNYLSNLFNQLQEMPLIFAGMPDQLAMAISTKVRVNSKELAKIDLTQEPAWPEVKAFVGVHADARACVTEIMENTEEELKTAILLIHFYSSYDATPVKSEESDIDDDQDSYGYDSDDYDENY